MFYFLWTILNLALFALFISCCLFAVKTIWQTMGVLPLALILFGLYPLIFSASVPPPKFFAVQATGRAERVFTKLEDFHLAAIGLTTSYVADQVYSNEVYLSGLRFGHSWHTSAVQTSVAGRQLRYAVTGTLNWHLLGVTLYKQPKRLTGIVALP